MQMTILLKDLSHALRNLCKSPAFAATCVLSLALGIGANVTIYSIVREMVLDDISARQPDRLVRVAAEIPYGRYRDLRVRACSRTWRSISGSRTLDGIPAPRAKLRGR